MIAQYVGIKGVFSYGHPLTAEVLCPKCLSLERHWAVAIFSAERALFTGKDILHFAPKSDSARSFATKRPRVIGPVMALLRTWIYASKLAIDLPDECVDLVLCLHVLEHVDDDEGDG